MENQSGNQEGVNSHIFLTGLDRIGKGREMGEGDAEADKK